ncbi:type II toxin-antitoxin system RelE/ParE family toxin [Novosphingobium huizhouense]|uniref:type II toxin-antitoxin system RelE/ParE family toxin n=1 Tax=Novosphingobium huizhouense TaxID=2866625 RepID=UPI001CD909FE|nr:type II toxin-antitoxin system RelE/ParE family toxin [Novosphingobium huizhouense]
MTHRIERAARARDDLVEVWLYLAAHDPSAADRQLRRLDSAIASLADFPRLGRARDDMRPGIRSLLCAPHLVLYDVSDDLALVRVIRVIDARRDLPSIEIEP